MSEGTGAVSGAPEARAGEPTRMTVAVLAHNAVGHINECLDAVMKQSRMPDEVILIDNASTDGTADFVKEHYPTVVIFRNAENSGCSGGRNDQIRRSTHRYVMIVDDDAFLAPDCLELLEQGMAARGDASIWAPRICYEQDRERIQFDGGGEIHFVCEAVLRNPDKLLAECPSGAVEARELGFQGGVAFMLDKDSSAEVGGYDQTFFFGRTDGEYSFRLVLLGKIIVHTPEAVVFHRVKPRGMAQVERQVRNRWTLMLRTYSASTLVVIFPALLVYESALLVFLAIKGNLGAYFSAWRQLLGLLPEIRAKRRGFIARKRVNDREVLVAGSINMRADLKTSRPVQLGLSGLNYFFAAYWYVARQLLRIFQRS